MTTERGITEGFFLHFGDGKKKAYAHKMWPVFEAYDMTGLTFKDWEEVKRNYNEDGSIYDITFVRGFVNEDGMYVGRSIGCILELKSLHPDPKKKA
jgi:hypothetical protein